MGLIVEQRFVDASRGSADNVLPSVAAYVGQAIFVSNVSLVETTLTVRATGTETIDGEATVTLTSGQAALFISDGVYWRMLKGSSRVTPMCHVYNSAAHTTGSGTALTLTFDSERYDTNTMHSTASDTSRITFTTAGKYHVGASVEWADAASLGVGVGERWLICRLNGTTVINEVGVMNVPNNTAMLMGFDYEFAAGDYIELRAYQDSGQDMDTVVFGTSPGFWAHRIGN